MELKKEDWKIIGGIAGIALLYYLLVRPKNKKGTNVNEPKSSFIGSPFGKRVMFTLKNTTDKVQEVPLFNSYSNTQNPNVSITPSISEFNRTLLNEPKIVRAIEIRAGGNNKQVEKPISKICKDASGEMKSQYLYPMVSPYQAQPGMTTIEPKNLIISGDCYLKFSVMPKTTMIVIVHYDLEPRKEKKTTKTKNREKASA